MRNRRVWISAAVTAIGVAAFGSVVAQPPVTAVGTLPATTVPASGTKPRLTTPVMASAEGVRPFGNFELPPPRSTEPPVASRPAIPPALPLEPTEKSLPLPSVPALPSPSSVVPPPAPPVIPATPAIPAPPSPFAPSPFPAASPPIATPPAVGAAPPFATAPVTTGILPGRASPSVTVETVCPETVGFGQEFHYKLVVRNTSTAPVTQIRVEGELPAGSRYVGSEPMGELNGHRLAWSIGSLDGGAEKQFSIRVKPSEEGEVSSRATVTFTTAVDARTRVTRPRLAVAVVGAEVCRAGDETTFQIKVTNGGTGPATRAIVKAHLSDGLHHAQGLVIESPLENLPAGETKMLYLKVAAAKAGQQWCQIAVAAEGSPDVSAKASTNVVEPMLLVKQTGPAKCLVRAEPTYAIELSNPGTSATDPVLLQTVLPDGFEWINQASDNGSCTGRTVVWRLPALAAGSTRTVTLKLRAVTATDAQGSLLRTVAQAGGAAAPAAPTRPAGRGLEAKVDTPVVAEGVAAVRFDVVGLDNPVAVGKEAIYEIRVINQGTGACGNVQIAASLAEGTEFVAATIGNQASGVKAQGQNLAFDPLPTLGVKGEVIYRVRVKGNAAGDHRFRVLLTCDQLKTPVIKEESTTFVKE